jgi:hypothetical protein
MFGRFQRCYDDELDLVRIVSTRERRRCDDLQRARDENNYILARQENLLYHIRELTIELDRTSQRSPTNCHTIAKRCACMTPPLSNSSGNWLLQNARFRLRGQTPAILPPNGPQCPPRDRRLALLAYIEALTVSRAIAFSELARVRQEMGRLAVLSYMHRTHSSATGCQCNTYEAKCAGEWNLTYPLPNILEIRAMEEQESQGRPVCPPGPVVFHPGLTQDSLRKLQGNLSNYFKIMSVTYKLKHIHVLIAMLNVCIS